jgi:hypothetical protein
MQYQQMSLDYIEARGFIRYSTPTCKNRNINRLSLVVSRKCLALYLKTKELLKRRITS